MSTATYVQRLRVVFRKFGSTRFIGHLDLARAWERTLNRAQRPVAYTQGFNRRPRMQFATATPLGVTSEAEIMDILLDEVVDPLDMKTVLAEKMPPGIEVVSIVEVPIKEKSLQANTKETTYTVNVGQDISLAELAGEVSGCYRPIPSSAPVAKKNMTFARAFWIYRPMKLTTT